MARASVLAILCLTGAVAFGCSVPATGPASRAPAAPTAEPSPTAEPPATTPAFTSEADGLVLTVTADPAVVAPGETITFTASVRNDRSQPVDYYVPWCGGAASLWLSVEVPRPVGGQAWTGIEAAFKDYVLGEAMGPGIVPAFDPLRVDVGPSPCRGGQVEALMAPGETLTSSMTWKAEIVEGVPAMSGRVPFRVTVSYERQNDPPSRAPDATGLVMSWIPQYKELTMDGSVTVVGKGRPLADPGEVVDAILADDGFARWLADKPRSTWTNTNLFLTSQRSAEGIAPAGPSWELDLFRENGIPRNWAIAFIDPFDPTVRSITYCNIPCDR